MRSAEVVVLKVHDVQLQVRIRSLWKLGDCQEIRLGPAWLLVGRCFCLGSKCMINSFRRFKRSILHSFSHTDAFSGRPVTTSETHSTDGLFSEKVSSEGHHGQVKTVKHHEPSCKSPGCREDQMAISTGLVQLYRIGLL